MSENMLRNLIELSDRPGGFTVQDFQANFPDNPSTWDELGRLANDGLVIPHYSEGDVLHHIEVTQDGRNQII